MNRKPHAENRIADETRPNLLIKANCYQENKALKPKKTKIGEQVAGYFRFEAEAVSICLERLCSMAVTARWFNV